MYLFAKETFFDKLRGIKPFLSKNSKKLTMKNLFFKTIALGLVCFYFSCQSSIEIDYSGTLDNWTAYGGTPKAQRYSSLTQITPENVGQLELAWEYHTGDVSDGQGAIPVTTAFQATPILINNTLYVPSPFNKIIALDPETGVERWKYDPEIDLTGNYANQLICRGLSFWETTDCQEKNCAQRIFMATNDARLISVDPKTGKPDLKFGIEGEVELASGAGKQLYKGEYQVTSPPAIARNIVIVGSAVADNTRIDAPSGVVRGFDVKSGELRWAWDLSPPNDSLVERKFSDEGYMLGTPNVWAPMSVDEERDLVFVPTGNPAPDYYGGLRNNLDFYGSSVVALRGSTGEVVWNYQTVRHDLWDFDVPAQPTLVDIDKNGETIPAVIQSN